MGYKIHCHLEFGGRVWYPLLLQSSFAVYNVGLDYDFGAVARHSPPQSRSAVVATLPDLYLILFSAYSSHNAQIPKLPSRSPYEQSHKSALTQIRTQKHRLLTPIPAHQSPSPPIIASIPQIKLLNIHTTILSKILTGSKNPTAPRQFPIRTTHTGPKPRDTSDNPPGSATSRKSGCIVSLY